MIELSSKGIRLSFDPDLGMIQSFHVSDGEKEIAPLHLAPWVGSSETLPDDIAPHLKKLGGDFFCAPFGGTEGGSALHGWPAKSSWRMLKHTGDHLRVELRRRVFGATLCKEITLRPNHPFVYQRHVFSGGDGHVPVANHANVALPNGGAIRTSPKLCWKTPNVALETDPNLGRSGLVYPAESPSLAAFPGIGGDLDLTRYPWFPNHEDFVIGLEASGHELGWTAVTRPVEGDLFLSLRAASALPMTMLWHSNGGRDYPPWSGRHFGCLGVEEGAAGRILNSQSTDEASRVGDVALTPTDTIEVAHVIGAIPWPSGSAVRSIDLVGDRLRICGADEESVSVPIEADMISST